MIPLFAFLASLTACESNDLPIQHADNYRYITFAARTQKMTTRADDRYESYDPVQRMHPENMGVFGYYNFATHSFETTGTETGGENHAIFDNTQVVYNTSTKTWSTTEEKRWDAYQNCNFDFFGYMPHSTAATLSKPSATESTYLLTIPFSMPTVNGKPSPILAQKDLRQAPIICAKPEHKGSTAALWVLLDFIEKVEYHSPDNMPAKLVFFADGEVYEVICVSPGKEALLRHALAAEDDSGQRLVIIEEEDQMQHLHIPHIAAYCMVDEQGCVQYFRKEEPCGQSHPLAADREHFE